MTIIALDAMGGDFAPRVPVEAALRASSEIGCEVILVGDREALERELSKNGAPASRLRIHHSAQRIEMNESPSLVLRAKSDASVRVAFELQRVGEADAVVSAGHSGAMMVAGKRVLGMLEGIDRPAIAVALPWKRGVTLFLDCGANVDCKPHYLLQFALMGQDYAHTVLGISQPRVALLSNGAEAGKGNELTRGAHKMLGQAPIRFIGNLEGGDLFKGKADVIVSDGFVGNLVLKAAQAANDQVRLLIKEAVAVSWLARFGFSLMRRAYREVEGRTDYRSIGASLLLGLDGVAMVSHGGSNARAMHSAIQAAHACVERGLVQRIRAEIRERAEKRHALA